MELDIYLKNGVVVMASVGEYGFTSAAGDSEFSWTDLGDGHPSLAYLKLDEVAAIVKCDDAYTTEESDPYRIGKWSYGSANGDRDDAVVVREDELSDVLEAAIELSESVDYVVGFWNEDTDECMYLIYGGLVYGIG